jgi:hypothetical protein
MNQNDEIQDKSRKYKTKNKLITNARITTNCCYSLWWVTKTKRVMKQMISVLSNTHYSQEQNDKEFDLKPMLEVIIIYADGKEHKLTPKGIKQEVKLSEVRMIVSPVMLESLITDLQLHQKKLNGIRENADKLNALVKHINSDVNEKKP